MKVDYEKFPEIPAGCQLNYNKKTKLYQVFRETRSKDPETGKTVVTRETLGSIRDDVWRPSKGWQDREKLRKLEQKCLELQQQCADLKRGAALEQDAKERPIINSAKAVASKITDAAAVSKLDARQAGKTQIKLPAVATTAVLSALAGNTDALSISNYIETHRALFRKYLPDIADQSFSHDVVRKSLILAEPAHFKVFYSEMIARLISDQQDRVICADGQVICASGKRQKDKPGKRRAYMMNVYDSAGRVCLATELIDSKTNEITVGYRMLMDLELKGSIVTADAMNCQVCFIDTVIEKGADYAISLKGNQDATLNDVMNVFNTAHPDNIITKTYGPELEHGRLENREVSVISGKFLSQPLKSKWTGLEDGCAVRVRKEVCDKAAGNDTDEYSYYICSIPGDIDNIDRVYTGIRSHWHIENKLHYVLDVNWSQDAMQAKNPVYIANRSTLNKLALAMVENYRFWLCETGRLKSLKAVSIKQLQLRCRNPEIALECMAASLLPAFHGYT